MADESKAPKPTDGEMSSAKEKLGDRMYVDQLEGPGKGASQAVGENEMGEIDKAARPGGGGGGLGDFLFQFLKSNPDIAREISTRMNAVINGQKLQGLKGGPAPGGIPVPNPGQMGIRGEVPQSMGVPPPQPGAQPPQQVAAAPTQGLSLQQMLSGMRPQQG